MKKLTKQFIVVYSDDKQIIVKSDNNKETYVPKDRLCTEFDTEEELNEFITNNQLQDEFQTED